MRRIKIFHAFAYCDAVARERTSFWLKKHAYTGSSSRRQAVRSVGEFAGHRSTEQCAISLSSRTTFFFLFYFFTFSPSLVLSCNCHRVLTRTPLAFFIILVSSRHSRASTSCFYSVFLSCTLRFVSLLREQC